MRQRDHRLEQLVRDRRKRDGDPMREFERRASQIRLEAESTREMERKLVELRDELGVFE